MLPKRGRKDTYPLLLILLISLFREIQPVKHVHVTFASDSHLMLG